MVCGPGVPDADIARWSPLARLGRLRPHAAPGSSAPDTSAQAKVGATPAGAAAPAPPEPPVELPPAVTDDHRDDLLQIPWGAIGVGLGGGVALLVVVAVLATVGGVSAVLLGGGLTVRPVTPVTTNKPQDPIAAPPAPTADVTGKLSDGRVYRTWQPTQQAGMHYAVTVRRSGREDLTREVALSALDVEAVPGRNCATVVVVGPDGRESAGVEGCLEVP